MVSLIVWVLLARATVRNCTPPCVDCGDAFTAGAIQPMRDFSDVAYGARECWDDLEFGDVDAIGHAQTMRPLIAEGM